MRRESGPPLYERSHEAAEVVLDTIQEAPTVGVILGSGLGDFAARIADRVVIPYSDIPYFPRPTVAGHRGNLVVGTIGGTRTAVLQGRLHYYEGHDLESVTFPVRLLQAMGAEALVLTAAVGGIHAGLAAGDLVMVRDHLNLLGANPLRGPNDERLGVRFLDQTAVYDPALRDLAMEEAGRLGMVLHTGVYACMPGPCYETPAEVRMLATLGADIVGMSTVPEAIVAHHGGLRVLALAVVANLAAGISPTPLSHEDVLEAGRQAEPRVCALLEAVLRRLSSSSHS